MIDQERKAMEMALDALKAAEVLLPVNYKSKWIGIETIAAFEAELAKPEKYDQTTLELCDKCGWKTLIPDDCCLNCERNQPEQEPFAWIPIEQMYPQAKTIDILMGDGSILCAVLPQFDGDLWWGGSGTGEKFIAPEYANVTHWRIHSDTAPVSKPWVGLTAGEMSDIWLKTTGRDWVNEDTHVYGEAIEAALRSKNNG